MQFLTDLQFQSKQNQRSDVESSDVSVKQMQGVEFRWDFFALSLFSAGL